MMAEEALRARADIPEVPDDEPEGAAALRTLCPARHDLQRFVVPWSGDFICDRCLQDIDRGGIMWSCRCCIYDVCDGCSIEGLGCHGVALHSVAGASPSSCSRRIAVGQADLVARHASRHTRPGPGRCFAYRFDMRPGGCESRPGASVREEDLSAGKLRQLVEALREELGGAAAKDRPPQCGEQGSTSIEGALSERRHSTATSAEQSVQRFDVPPAELDEEWALRTVNATTAELSRLMGQVQRAPREEKKVLLTKVALVEASGEYVAALQHLRQEPPRYHTDPLGGSVLV